jgi:hypothetical protein
MGCDAGHSMGGHVRNGVFDACDVEDGGRGRAGTLLAHGQPFEEAIGNGGCAAAGHASGPCNRWGIIAADCNLHALHGRAKVGFKHRLMEQNASHF